jgi:DNA-binding transcriptional regulator YhcF (GntR family)
MIELNNPYERGHLIVAALRIFVHKNHRPPSVRELSEMIDISAELGHYLCKNLQKLGVLEIVDAPFEERVTLKDHLKLEELPREESAPDLEAEVEKFKEHTVRRQQEIQSLTRAHEEKKKDLFSDLERQLKGGIKKRKNPLDDL